MCQMDFQKCTAVLYRQSIVTSVTALELNQAIENGFHGGFNWLPNLLEQGEPYGICLCSPALSITAFSLLYSSKNCLEIIVLTSYPPELHICTLYKQTPAADECIHIISRYQSIPPEASVPKTFHTFTEGREVCHF